MLRTKPMAGKAASAPATPNIRDQLRQVTQAGGGKPAPATKPTPAQAAAIQSSLNSAVRQGMGATGGGKPAPAPMPAVTTGGGMPRPGMAPGGMGGMGATGGGKPAPAMPMKKAGGKVSSASKRADGCAQKGKTKGRIV